MASPTSGRAHGRSRDGSVSPTSGPQVHARSQSQSLHDTPPVWRIPSYSGQPSEVSSDNWNRKRTGLGSKDVPLEHQRFHRWTLDTMFPPLDVEASPLERGAEYMVASWSEAFSARAKIFGLIKQGRFADVHLEPDVREWLKTWQSGETDWKGFYDSVRTRRNPFAVVKKLTIRRKDNEADADHLKRLWFAVFNDPHNSSDDPFAKIMCSQGFFSYMQAAFEDFPRDDDIQHMAAAEVWNGANPYQKARCVLYAHRLREYARPATAPHPSHPRRTDSSYATLSKRQEMRYGKSTRQLQQEHGWA